MMAYSGLMRDKYGNSDYATVSPGKCLGPAVHFYLGSLFGPLRWLWQKARRNECDDVAWTYGSAWFGDVFEGIGGKIIIEGMADLEAVREPCVIIANHMSTLETFLLPAIIRPRMPVTFVVKKSLTTMPFFGPIMRSRDPVVVERKNPRIDLSTVLEQGSQRLKQGISVIVFPQHTRTEDFNPEIFNTIGVKLARKANVPVLPLALKTDAWGIGKRIKELGRIRPDLPARFKFAPAMPINGNGKSEHLRICEFIGESIAAWRAADGRNA